MRSHLVPAAFILCAPLSALGADLKSNTQFWSEVDLKASIAPDWRATLLAVSREGEGLPNPTLWGGGLLVDYRTGNWTLSAGDFEVAARSAVSGAERTVNLPLAALTYTWHLGTFVVSDRNRVEDLQGVPGNPWRYRNRLSIEHDVEGLGPISSVFVNDEGFLDLQTGQWTRNRAQIGFALNIVKQTKLEIYYLRQDDGNSLPSAINALGTTLVIELP